MTLGLLLLSRRELGAIAALVLSGSLFGGVPPAGAAEPAVSLRKVTDDVSGAGLQAQRPVWGSGRSPQLAFQLTDRAHSTHLKVASFWANELNVTSVSGSNSGRLGGLGAGERRADMAVSWWPGRRDFVFARSLDGVRLMYYDGTVRAVPDLPDGPVLEASLAGASSGLDVVLNEGRETVIHRVSIEAGMLGESRPLLRSSAVLHSVVSSVDGESVTALQTSRDATELLQIDVASGEVKSKRSYPGLELLSVASAGASGRFFAYARRVGTAPQSEGTNYVLLALDHGSPEAVVLADAVYLPPGLAPRPASSGSGQRVYFVEANPALGNPIVRLDRSSGGRTVLPLSTRGHQEVAVGEFSDASGQVVPWVAVVAVGDQTGDDVTNHLYIGPLGSWPNW
jgi:hypothetical protein